MGNNQSRWHPLLQEWVIIAAQTQNRPWSGAVSAEFAPSSKEHDPDCYLCPRVERASGICNPDYQGVYVFDNDFASFSLDNTPEPREFELDLYITQNSKGCCKVICFGEKHNLSLAQMPLEGINQLIDTWQEEFNLLASHDEIKNILIFENKGKVIGVSNEHPHGQIYANIFVPKSIEIQQRSYSQYRELNNSCLMCELIQSELEYKQRVIIESEHFVAFVPFYARFAYEVWIVPKHHHSAINSLSGIEKSDFAAIYQQMLIKYDNLFEMEFPNITALINSPVDSGVTDPNFHMYLSFTPPMRDAEKLKYLAGFESAGGNIINPLLPEDAAKTLKRLSSKHYSISQA